jgi:hypothetical protein
MNKKQLKQELIKRLEIRKQQLEAEPLNLKYKIHNGHHLRDVFTVLAYLNGSENIEALIKNLPDKEDLPRGD